MYVNVTSGNGVESAQQFSGPDTEPGHNLSPAASPAETSKEHEDCHYYSEKKAEAEFTFVVTELPVSGQDADGETEPLVAVKKVPVSQVCEIHSGDKSEQPCTALTDVEPTNTDNDGEVGEVERERELSYGATEVPFSEPHAGEMDSGDKPEQPCTVLTNVQPVKAHDDSEIGEVEGVTKPSVAVTEVPVSEPDAEMALNNMFNSIHIGISERFLTTGKSTLLILGSTFLVVLLAVWYSPVSPPEDKVLNRTEIFLREMEKVKEKFPGQRSELWRRTRIHLERHLQTAQPTEPVSLMLTAGRRGERTLHCLANRLGFAFASALNASVLHINGTSKAGQDSDLVKLDIDGQLREAFEGDQLVAVIHHFEVLPPSSTIIFYRYCDHENSAYKEVLIIFTVMLAGEEDLSASLKLSAVEEMVDDHLQDVFVSSGQPAAYDMMDRDKYSGLWSRISHLVLPVAAEKSIEKGVCV
ncbi:torsin-1A-interacting protein 2-like isoform X3 [Esox lucius]|uniref:torsin-1A-interacting protein 2-like isoform X3 n=1 Tax=Esox lucius TaxID=8010 RepID=UPI0009732522|nr:torsin-1A-interacting protein 2-like isoform X3 [Esox lucius]